jgi:hypothetical protein
LTTSLLVCAWLGGTGLRAQAQPLTWLGGFEGINSGWTPADPIIAAGPSSLVTMVSGKIGVFNKQGTKLFEQNLGAGGFWWPVGGDQVAEPWVIFDPHTDRFMAIAAEVGNQNGTIYLAISTSSNPIGSADWNKYALNLAGTHVNGTGEPTAPDYPKLGVDSAAVYITGNHYGVTSGGYSHAQILAIEKLPLLSGGAVPPPLHNESLPLPHFSIHPTVVHDPAPGMYFVKAGGVNDMITVHHLSAGTRTAWLVPVSPYNNPPGVPQPGTGVLLDSVDRRIMSGVVRNGSLWTGHAIQDPAVDAEAVVRWYQFNVTGAPGSAPTLLQSGNVDPGPGVHTWLPHINVDADGNMGLGFSVGGANQYAAIGYTGRFASDPAGTTHPVQIARAGTGAYTQGGWGEYSGLAIDPDGYTFWLFNEYPIKPKGNASGWRTFVGAFEVIPPAPLSDPLHCGDLDRSAANSGKNWKATVVVTVHDGAEDPVPGATASVQWSTGATDTRVTDATGKATFTLNSISKQTPSVSLTMTSVTHASLTYSDLANHDQDGDSNGTSITVNKP